MPNHLKFCSCRMCRIGRHQPYGKFIVRAAIRKLRQGAKRLLKRGEEPPNKGGVPYTD